MKVFTSQQEVIVFDDGMSADVGGVLGYHGRIVGESELRSVYRVYVPSLERVVHAPASAIFSKDESAIERMAGASGVVEFDQPGGETDQRRTGIYRLHGRRRYRFEFRHAEQVAISIELAIPAAEGSRDAREIRVLVPVTMKLTDQLLKETLAGIVCFSQQQVNLRSGRRRRRRRSGISDTSVAEVLTQLLLGPDLVVPLVKEVPPAILKRRPAPGIWSAHEHACHLAAVQPMMMERLDHMLSHPTPVITPYEPARDDADDALLRVDLDEAMARFRRDRNAMVRRLRQLTPDQWAIKAEHGEYSHYSVFIMFRHLGLHDLYHAYRIEQRLLNRDWADDL